MLEIKNVTKSFDRPLFKEMSMTFQETGMYVIVGKSGIDTFKYFRRFG